MNARVPGLNAEQVLREVTQAWDSDIVRQLSDYIAIPAKSPAFDAQWQAHGHLETVVQRAADWVRAQKVEGLTLEIVRLPGRTPILWFEVPATRALAESAQTVLMYGHLDKQPEFNGWRSDLGELHHPYLFDVIDEVSAQCGWDGWIGCEYRPKAGGQPGGTSAGLGWFRAMNR